MDPRSHIACNLPVPDLYTFEENSMQAQVGHLVFFKTSMPTEPQITSLVSFFSWLATRGLREVERAYDRVVDRRRVSFSVLHDMN